MQKHEVKKILEQLINLYPSMKLTKDTAAIWVECLQDISYENAYNNLLEHAKNSQYAPTIANIRGSNQKRQQRSSTTTAKPPAEFMSS